MTIPQGTSGAAPRHLLLADAHLHQCECGDWHSGVFLREQAEAASAAGAAVNVDVERLGFYDLLDVADAILRHYPPDTIVCSHRWEADPGSKTVAAIADLIASSKKDRRAYNAPATPEAER